MQTPVAALAFFVWKKDGCLRSVTDYRPLNRIAVKDDYSMPKIHDLISRRGKARWSRKVALREGY